MKALIVEAEWKPQSEYNLSEYEQQQKKAFIASLVWRNPRFELKDVPVPDIEEDEILIRVKDCGICGSDVHLYETDPEGYVIFSGLAKLPCILGHEFSGVIEKTGRTVYGLKKGDYVAVESVMWCGVCQPCRSGAFNQCANVELMGLSKNGAFAEYAAVKGKYCWKINALSDRYPENQLFEMGALIEPVGCAYNGMFIAAGGFHPGATVVVYGAGPIGLGAISLAKIAGAGMVIAFDVIDERVKLAEELGADFVFNLRKLNARGASKKVMELTKGGGADIQVEAAGAAPITIPEMENSLAVNGKIIYLGRAATKTPMYLDALVTGANKIIGSRGHTGYGIYPSIIKLMSSGRLVLDNMITGRYPFIHILDAMKSSAQRKDGKIMIKIG